MNQNTKEIIKKIVNKDLIFKIRDLLLDINYLYFKYFLPKKFSQINNLIRKRPIRLGIETINICNANCIFCAYQYQTRDKQVMDEKLYKKAINDYVNIGGGDIELTPIVGDSFVDKDFLNKVSYASSFSEIKEILVFTNAIALNHFETTEILNSGITTLSISTSAIDEDMYKRMYRNNSYSTVIKNIITVLEENSKLDNPIEIRIHLRGDLSFDKVKKFEDYKKIQKYEPTIMYANYYDDWGGAIKEDDFIGDMKMSPSIHKNGPCKLFLTYPKILVDGSVTACGCRDYDNDPELRLGNIKENSFEEIWGNGKIDTLFERFNRNDYPKLCDSCNQYRQLNHYIASKEGQKAILSVNK